jgi:hypothetical protein
MLDLGYFSSSKNFNYVTKDASILHLKSGNNDKLDYFPTSTPSRHNPHRHGRPILGNWLVRWRDFDI